MQSVTKRRARKVSGHRDYLISMVNWYYVSRIRYLSFTPSKFDDTMKKIRHKRSVAMEMVAVMYTEDSFMKG